MNDVQVVMWLIFIMLILVFLMDNSRRPPTGGVLVKDHRDLSLWAQIVGDLD